MIDNYILKTLEAATEALKSKKVCYSKFLDPFRQKEIEKKAKSFIDLHVMSYGGYEGAERRKLGFSTLKDALLPQNFPVAKVKIEYDKGSSIAHKDILGAAIGLGINRDKLGDVAMLVDSACIITDSKIAVYIVDNLQIIGKTSATCTLLGYDDIIYPLDNKIKDHISSSSLRFDNILSVAFNVSRPTIVRSIKKGSAFINWQKMQNPTKQIKNGDMLTLRGYGRIKIEDIQENDKKGGNNIDIIRF